VKRSTDRILTTLAGSLIRPPSLFALTGETDERTRAATLRETVGEVVREQVEVGIEHPELIAQRLWRFTDLVGREYVIASSDCAFAQGAVTQRQVRSIQCAKLSALVEGARLASRQPVPA
jgi:methionine synthase II (cobalamin-independent)